MGCEKHQSGKRSEQSPKDTPAERCHTTTVHPEPPCKPSGSGNGQQQIASSQGVLFCAVRGEQKGRRAQELTQEDAAVSQRQDALSAGLQAGGSCRSVLWRLTASTCCLPPPAAACGRTRAGAQPRRSASMQTYAAISAKIASANISGSLFMGCPSPGREEEEGQVQSFYLKSLRGTRGREGEMDEADGDRESRTTGQTNLRELISCRELC